ncbi:hypothetical protein B0H65DRAFT_551545 [Neurospora tetraspora]|uniref:Uncharacterized protein n=1 Tax=Neurospora tetraspora TaxID=94610 RepID=A0AAE0J870_9PEZI|nr:hypothetical protein B0H65DRAFT_551545 [Neurospora tetraspora]
MDVDDMDIVMAEADALPIALPKKAMTIKLPPTPSLNPFNFANHLEDTHTAGFCDRFQSDEDFEAQKAEYLARHNNRGKAEVNLAKYPNCLDDLPTTHEERTEWRRQLFGAIRDLTMVGNQGRRKAGADNSQIENTDVRRCRELDDFQVEMIGYEILKKAEKAHQGQVDIGAWTESQQWGFEQFPSFAARMHWLLRAVRVNKAVPMDYCEPDFLMRWA